MSLNRGVSLRLSIFMVKALKRIGFLPMFSLKKTVSSSLLLCMLFSMFSYNIEITYAADNSALEPFLIPNFIKPDPTIAETAAWSREDAEHLARKALIAPTNEDVNALLRQGSRVAAVNYLFTAPSQAELNAFQTKLDAYAVSNNENLDNSTYMEKLYLFTLMHDPFQAKRKAWLIWEDTFSVDAPIGGSRDIKYTDVQNLHNLLYTDTLGNYKDLVKAMPTNYAMGKYLDLLNANKNRPNENFARELLQLFLMEENPPLRPNVENYTSEDVASLARILTGYTVEEGSRNVQFVAENHNENLFAIFGDERNNPSTIIDFIFAEREKEIAEFISAKLLRFYVHDNYSAADLELLSEEFIANNFEIEETIKWLLSSEIFYRDSSKNAVVYKNPIELIAGTYKYFYQNTTLDYEPTKSWSNDLGFRPYRPNSIFGRIGFEENDRWFNAYSLNYWVNASGELSFQSSVKPMAWNIGAIVDWINDEAVAPTKTVDDLIDELELAFLLGRELKNDTRNDLRDYLTKDSAGAAVVFAPTDANYQNKKIRGAIQIILSQTEYLMQTGHDQNLVIDNSTAATSPFSDDANIVLVKLNGGYDYMHVVVPTTDPSYEEYRGVLAVEEGNRSDLGGGYALNNIADSLLPYYQSGELTFINSVGVAGHSRSHSKALYQMETGLLDNGVFGEFFKDVDNASSDLISLYNGKPSIYKGSDSLAIGTGKIDFSNSSFSDNEEEQYIFSTIKDNIKDQSLPSDLSLKYINAIRLDEISKKNKENGGRGNSGYNNSQQFDFLESLLDDNFGKVFYMRGNGGYDTHGNQLNSFNNRFETLSNDISSFYNSVKDKHKVSVVVYSEFGRTNKTNGNNGTDHGLGGGMIVLSNHLEWPNMVGKLAPSEDSRNWLTPRVDARSVWSSLLGDHFDENAKDIFSINKTLPDYYNSEKPEIKRFSINEMSSNSAYLRFKVEDSDFDFGNNGLSEIDFSFGETEGNLNRSANASINGGYIEVSLNGLISDREYFFEIVLTDDQINSSNPITGSFRTPKIKQKEDVAILEETEKQNIIINDVLETVEGGQLLVLNDYNLTLASSSTLQLNNNVVLKIPANTRINSINNTSGSVKTWNGFFMMPQEIDVDEFFFSNEEFSVGNLRIRKNEIINLMKVGSVVPGMSLNLNKNATITINTPSLDNGNSIKVLYSSDGDNWDVLGDYVVNNKKVTFSTNHFTFFAVVDDVIEDDDEDDEDRDDIDNKHPNNSSSSFFPIMQQKPKGPFAVEVQNIAGKSIGETNTPNVWLKLEHGINVNRYSVSEDIEFVDASIYHIEGDRVMFNLSEGEGIKNIYVRYYTKYGIPSEIKMVTVVYRDKQVPTSVKIEKNVPEGILVRTTKIYVIKNGIKTYIPNLDELMKYQGREIHDVSNAELRKYEINSGATNKKYSDGELIRESAIYYYDGDKKYRVKNVDELQKYKHLEMLNVGQKELDRM